MNRENDDRPHAAIVRQGANHFWEPDAKESDNPYPPNTKRWAAWNEGWSDAKLQVNLKAKNANETFD